MLSVVMRNAVMLMEVQPLSYLIIMFFAENFKKLFTRYIFAYHLIFIGINHRDCNKDTQRERERKRERKQTCTARTLHALVPLKWV
jgi:hypothetical protein